MIILPKHKQCLTVQKLDLNVKKLQDNTMEAMSNWFNDKEHPDNNLKKVFLKEIFKVALAEEAYLSGGIGKSFTQRMISISELTNGRCNNSNPSLQW